MKMARVNVEQKALTDPRFYRFGLDLGADPKHAHAVGLFAMVKVWNECIERGKYTLEGWLIDATLGSENVGESIVNSDLATRCAGGRFRLRGTKGRVEYLEEKRKLARINGQKGGRPRKPTLVSKKTDVGVPRETPLTPALTPAPALALAQKTEEKTPLPPAKPGGEDFLFDALAEVCGIDPTVKSVNRTLTRKTDELANAHPPYTPDEVREFGKRFWELCPDAKDKRERPTPPQVARWIGLLRTKKRRAHSPRKTEPLPPPTAADEVERIRKLRDLKPKEK
jgi:hypothetical protein